MLPIKSFILLGILIVTFIAVLRLTCELIDKITMIKGRDNEFWSQLTGGAISIVPIVTLSLTEASSNLWLLGVIFSISYVQLAFFRRSIENIKDRKIYVINLIYIFLFFIIYLPSVNSEASWLGLTNVSDLRYGFEIWNINKTLIIIGLCLLYIVLEFIKIKQSKLIESFNFKVSFLNQARIEGISSFINNLENVKLLESRKIRQNNNHSVVHLVRSIAEHSKYNLNFIVWAIVLILTILLVCSI